MKQPFNLVALTAAAMLLGSSLSYAVENNVGAEQGAAGKARMDHDVVTSHKEARRKATAAKNNPVDINNATRKQLQQLPGVTDVVAKKIIAGRPYASTRDLLTRNIINKEVYDNIRRRIYIKPGNKSAPKK